MTKKKWLLIGIGALLVVCVLGGIIVGTSDSEETKAEEAVIEEAVAEEAVVEKAVVGADLVEADMSECIVEFFEDANSQNAIMGMYFVGESAHDFCDTSLLDVWSEESGLFVKEIESFPDETLMICVSPTIETDTVGMLYVLETDYLTKTAGLAFCNTLEWEVLYTD